MQYTINNQQQIELFNFFLRLQIVRIIQNISKTKVSHMSRHSKNVPLITYKSSPDITLMHFVTSLK